ncbi:hypothetical protein SAMN05216489_00876 [Streptomyces sp. 3213]|uniref:hypothetical protein n=1 Tax=Streptomyces sp. 3213.3 TaxID=1855348 RepID=UPI0008972CEE|nr:hypothetical protein [Streptomyces sp. 3213.3]SEC49496.1 hypothetical protein SAMN05216489_00876 [Streptomyces sp. 3213] [Streptomyces sp. 3213.3]
MDSPIWAALSAAERSAVDELIRRDHRLPAVVRMREAFPAESRPGLYETLDVVAERYRELGMSFERRPTPPLDLTTLAERVEALPGRTVAIEAMWDGDSDGWCVDLMAHTDAPVAEYRLATVRHGGDLRLFNGTVPPWPEAREAETVGRALAERFGVPFHFAGRDEPEIDAPRWRTSS